MIKKNYLLYLFKKNFVSISIFTSILTLIYISLLVANMNIAYDELYKVFLIAFVFVNTALMILSFCFIPLNFGCFKNKIAADTYFALPIKKLSMLNTVLLFTVLEVFLVGIISSIIGIIGFGIFTGQFISLFKYLFIELFVIIIISLFVVIFTNLFMITNHIVDGILTMIGYMIIPVFMTIILIGVIGQFTLNVDQLFSKIMSILNYGLNPFLTLSNFISNFNNDLSVKNYLVMFCVSIIALINYFIFVNEVKNIKVENIGSLTKHILTYPLLITSLLFAIINSNNIISFELNSVFMIVVAFVICLVGNFVYNRQIAFKFKYLLQVLIVVLITGIFQYSLVLTKGFGLSYDISMSKEMSLRVGYNNCYISFSDNHNKYGLSGEYIVIDENIEQQLMNFMLDANDKFYENKIYNINMVNRYAFGDQGEVEFLFNYDRDKNSIYKKRYWYRLYDADRLKKILDIVDAKRPLYVNCDEYNNESVFPYKGNEFKFWGN